MKIKKIIGGHEAGILTLKKLVGRDWELVLIQVYELYRGQGVASALLERAKSYALNKGWMLVGMVGPSGDGLDFDQITKWLVRRGFRHSRYDFTKAIPRPWSKDWTKPVHVLKFNE